MLLTVQLLDQDLRNGMGGLVKGLASPTPFLRGIGEEGKKESQARIVAGGPAPDGSPWPELHPLTLALKKGPGKLRERGDLHDSIAWQEEGDGAVAIGSRMIYARIHQLGGTIRPKGERKALQTPSGPRKSVRIPARPYLGFSEKGKDRVLRKAALWLQKLAEE